MMAFGLNRKVLDGLDGLDGMDGMDGLDTRQDAAILAQIDNDEE